MLHIKPGFQVGVASDTGKKRRNNQDSWLINRIEVPALIQSGPNLFAVADGMGGLAAGEIASRTAVEELSEHYFSHEGKNPLEALKKAIGSAHEKINKKAQEIPEYRGMGTTLTVVVIDKGTAYLAQIGDSRAYLIRKQQIMQLSLDQTVTADLLRKGCITHGEAVEHAQKHVLIQAMGAGRRAPEPAFNTYSVCSNDVFILCTDGLYNLVSDEEIKNTADAYSPQSAAERLVQLANERGGTDNITVIMVKIGNSKPLRCVFKFSKRFTGNTR